MIVSKQPSIKPLEIAGIFTALTLLLSIYNFSDAFPHIWIAIDLFPFLSIAIAIRAMNKNIHVGGALAFVVIVSIDLALISMLIF